MNPDDQLQIGDDVIYLPEGVYAKVDGYQWFSAIGKPPSIIGYRLSCGIVAPRGMIERRLDIVSDI